MAAVTPIKCRTTWTCTECTENNPLNLSECGLCAHRRPAPLLLAGAVAVSSVMVLCSGILTFSSLESAVKSNDGVRELLSIDAHAIENVGHAGLLVIFTGMYWLSGKLYCWYMVCLSLLFMMLVSGMSTLTAVVAMCNGFNDF